MANSLLGVSFTNIWDEFPFLFVFLGVESVFNLLPPVGSHSRGSTVQVMASAASRGWPKYVPWAILKALMWLSAGAVTYSISGTSGQEVSRFCVHLVCRHACFSMRGLLKLREGIGYAWQATAADNDHECGGAGWFTLVCVALRCTFFYPA